MYPFLLRCIRAHRAYAKLGSKTHIFFTGRKGNLDLDQVFAPSPPFCARFLVALAVLTQVSFSERVIFVYIWDMIHVNHALLLKSFVILPNNHSIFTMFAPKQLYHVSHRNEYTLCNSLASCGLLCLKLLARHFPYQYLYWENLTKTVFDLIMSKCNDKHKYVA